MHLFTKEKELNLQVEIILRIISIIILCSLIVLNRSIIIFHSESSTRWISLACCFPKVDSVFTFDFFFFNIIWFILILFGHQTLKKAVFDVVQWPNLYQTLVRKGLMGILFNFVLSNTLYTRNTHLLQLSVDHQGDFFTSCENSSLQHHFNINSFQAFPDSPFTFPYPMVYSP